MSKKIDDGKEEINEKFDRNSQQMAENNKTMEEKIDELKQDSQKNMEVLNQKMAENNEKVNKKIEEEMTLSLIHI